MERMCETKFTHSFILSFIQQMPIDALKCQSAIGQTLRTGDKMVACVLFGLSPGITDLR